MYGKEGRKRKKERNHKRPFLLRINVSFLTHKNFGKDKEKNHKEKNHKEKENKEKQRNK
jgi:hypothetical protein